MKNQNINSKGRGQYVVIAVNRKNNKVLNCSSNDERETLKKYFWHICFDLYAELEDDVMFDDIEFKLVRIHNNEEWKDDGLKKDGVNLNLFQLLDNHLLAYVKQLEDLIELDDSENQLLQMVFISIKRFIGNHIMVDTFQKKDKVEFISAKIITELNRLVFLTSEEKQDVFESFLGILVYLMAVAEHNEYFETASNLNILIALNFKGDYLLEKDKLKKTLAATQGE